MVNELIFSVYGHCTSIPIAILNEPLLGSFFRNLLFKARKGLSAKDLDKVISLKDVENILDVYIRLGVLSKENYFFKSIIPILDKEEKKPFMEKASSIADIIVKYISRHLRELISIYKRTSLPKQGFSWNDLSFTIIGGILLDQHLFKVLHEKQVVPPPPSRPDGGSWYLWCLENGTGSRYEYWVNIISSPLGGCGSIWIRGFRREYVHIYGELLRISALLAEGPKTLDEIAYETNLPFDFIGDIAKKFISLNLFRKENGKLKVNFPVFLRRDMEIMFSSARRLSREIVESILRRQLIRVLRMKYRYGYTHVDDASFTIMICQAIKHYSIEKLIELKVLPDPPNPIPANWGFWIWCSFK